MSTYSNFLRSSATLWKLLNKAPENAVCNIAETGQDIPATKADADKELLVLLHQRMNSSKQLPGLARIHNEHQQDSNTLQLLAVPEKVLEKILRFAVVDDNAICVAAAHPAESSEKARGALSVCHRFRELGRPIFYNENVFEIKVARFDIKAVLPWLKIAGTFFTDAEAVSAAAIRDSPEIESINTDSTMDIELAQPAVSHTLDSEITHTVAPPSETTLRKFGKPSPQVVKIFSKSFNHFVNPKPDPNNKKAKPATHNQLKMLAYFLGSKLELTLTKEPALPGEVYFVPEYEPHWANLVEWMRLYHGEEVGRYAYEKGDPNGSAAVQSMFDLVQIDKEEGNEWSAFGAKLDALRGILAATDDGWLDE